MDFGKIRNISNTDFTLPDDRPETLAVLASSKSSILHSPEIYIGCPVWGEKEWIGLIYPEGAKKKDFLRYYSRQFNTAEINASFYSIPPVSVVQRWKASVPPDFRFCPKVPQQISHERRLVHCETLNMIFCDTIRHLGDNLGHSFLQLPPDFSPAEATKLKDYVETFPEGIPLAVEFRHPGWFSDPNIFRRTFDWLEKREITSVITDVAGRRDVLHTRLTTSTAFIRFVTNDRHPSDFVRMEQWALRLKKWLDAGLQRLYFMAHTTESSLNPVMAGYMIGQMNKHCGLRLKEYMPLNRPEQKGLFG
jgi:uncharacterized protein YecE (DUF72 family)